MNKALLSAALASLALVTTTGAASADAGSPQQETFRYVIHGSFPGDQPTASAVVAHGLVNDTGKDQFGATQPGDPQNLYRDTFILSHGTLSYVTTRDVDEGTPPDPQTCKGSLTMAGTYRLEPGTGAYSGVSGAGTFTQQGRFTAKHLPGGGCSQTEGTYVIFGQATGTIAL